MWPIPTAFFYWLPIRSCAYQIFFINLYMYTRPQKEAFDWRNFHLSTFMLSLTSRKDSFKLPSILVGLSLWQQSTKLFAKYLSQKITLIQNYLENFFHLLSNPISPPPIQTSYPKVLGTQGHTLLYIHNFVIFFKKVKNMDVK